MPPLDPYLAAPCRQIDPSTLLDYDAWDDENVSFLEAMADCAIRHRKTVDAWPK